MKSKISRMILSNSFDFWNWSSMALGPVGSILGWTPFFQSIVQSEAKKSLDEFIAANGEYIS